MLQKINKQYISMGVVNATPNSFSDGAQSNTSETFRKKIEQSRFDILDIGAQSTAPFNPPIGLSEEWSRYKDIILCNKDILQNHLLSFDTYRIETMQMLVDEFPGFIIFNDVSGHIDDELIRFLKNNPKVIYVFCHNLAPTRNLSFAHMSYLTKVNMSDHIISFFKQGLEKLKVVENTIILDPCFGFSKTTEQNIDLLNNMEKLFHTFSQSYFLLGLSKKSFLRKSWESYSALDSIGNSELLHYYYIEKFKKMHSKLIFRMHHRLFFT